MAAAVIPLLIAAGTVATVSAIQQGRAAEAQGRTQEKIAQRNADIALKQAEEEKQAAAAQAIAQERRGRALIGEQRAKFAKSGVELRGSPLSVLVETAEELEADRLSILRTGSIAAGRNIAQAGIFRAQGSAAKASGTATKRASVLSAVGTGLSTAASVGFVSSRTGTTNKNPLASGAKDTGRKDRFGNPILSRSGR